MQVNSNNNVSNHRRQKASRTPKTKGQKIAQNERNLASLSCYENHLKNHMQDRKKFMSAKNAMRHDNELKRLAKLEEKIAAETKLLQG